MKLGFPQNLRRRHLSPHRVERDVTLGQGRSGQGTGWGALDNSGLSARVLRLLSASPTATASTRQPDKEAIMPEAETIKRAQEDAREGKSPSTQAGEFVREEIHHVREGKHGARSTKQAIAIGLSKARRAGVKLRPPRKRVASKRTRRQAARDVAKGRSHTKRAVSRTRSTAVKGALKREGHSAASHSALARQARSSARRRTASQRSAAAKRAARTRARHGR